MLNPSFTTIHLEKPQFVFRIIEDTIPNEGRKKNIVKICQLVCGHNTEPQLKIRAKERQLVISWMKMPGKKKRKRFKVKCASVTDTKKVSHQCERNAGSSFSSMHYAKLLFGSCKICSTK